MVESGDVQIALNSANRLDDSLELVKWLRHDRKLQGLVHVEMSSPSTGELGSLPDVLTVAVGSGGIATVLASSLVTWLQSRRSQTKIHITLTRADCTLDIETGDAAEAEDLIVRFLGEQQSGS